MKSTSNKEIFEKVENIMEQYCKGCFLHSHLKKEQGRRSAHRFCINECTVGEKLKKYGKRLS